MAKSMRFTLIFACIILVIVSIGLFFTIKPAITGFVVYEEQSHVKNWGFDNPDNYVYDDSLIAIADGEIKLIQIISHTFWNTSDQTYYSITAALHNSQDKTDKVNALDNKNFEVKQNKILDIFFNEELNNGDIISIYVKSGTSSDIYLRDYEAGCDAPGYGSVSYDGSEGWYNITVVGLSSATNAFSLNATKLKIDYIRAVHIEYEEHTSSNITYPSYAEIQTNDLEVKDLLSFDLFSKEESLNSQTIDYYYAVDSGLSWDEIPEDNNLFSANISNGKIRIKAVLSSDTGDTPVLENIAVSYSVQVIVCSEEWIAVYGECLIHDKKLKTYVDSNNCGTIDGLPDDNNIYANCDYCTPSWYEVNTSCNSNNIIIGGYKDSNNCYSITGIESDNNPPANNEYSCDYVISTTFSGSTTDLLSVNLSSITNPILEAPKYGKISFSETISINESIDLDSNIRIINNSIFVNSTALPEFNKSAVLALYNLSFVNPIILKDGVECPPVICRIIGYINGTIIFNVSHFTTYSISEGPYCGDGACNDGETCSTCSSDCGTCPSPDSGSGGGVSSWRRAPEVIENTTIEEETEKKEIKKEETYEDVTKETICDYSIEVLLHDEISFVEKDYFQGEIINRGNCDIENLYLHLSPNLEEITTISNQYLKNIKKGDNIGFSLIKKIEDKKGNLLTGTVTRTSKHNELITGSVVFEGSTEQEPVLKKELFLNVEILVEEEIIDKENVAAIALITVLGILLLVLLKRGRKKKTSKDY